VPVVSTIWAPSDATPICGPGAPAVVLSQPLEANLVVYRGDSGRFRVSVTEEGSNVDLSTAVWDADIRATFDDTAVLGTMTVTLVDAFTVEIFLPAAVSTALPPAGGVWDLQMTLDGDVTTLLRGTVTVDKDVSR
jgi:hypothetical protein